MRVMSFNANGIRAAQRKGFFEWMSTQAPDVVAIQELKAQQHQLDGIEAFWPAGYHCFYEEATRRKGYSGVALYSRREPDEIIRGMGHDEFDAEGRYIEARFARPEGDLRIASLYAPSGSSGDHRQDSKERYLAYFLDFLRARAAEPGDYLICGDWNIAHKEIDLKNWKNNRKNSGFLPHEREWMSAVFGDVGLVDVFREINPDEDQFTWWSQRGAAWDKNVGWRIDYHVATPGLAAAARSEYVYRESRLSDHAPLTIDYDVTF
ncbi:exodeoxyribonuclease III [Salinisphaera sp. Q1T1-3]|uniref:exodeoxyribonuclease III n=1 Tax=Salinisphaera sp. Q1T1-3 TaxID=2321229 RepID=UPI000E75A10C|nr:exodeoxyribonuclease III [Salinisphaera sp. Q1T1-3]RJS93974.1 exodeoxyribonuclease III [Salinisphaera sp. Q1T1-3]